MNTAITFTLADLGKFALWAALLVILVYIILILKRVHSSLKIVNNLIEDNRDSIDQVLEEAPELTKNVKDISAEVAHDTQAFRGTIDNVAEMTEFFTEQVRDKKSLVAGIASTVQAVKAKKKEDATVKEESMDSVIEEEEII